MRRLALVAVILVASLYAAGSAFVVWSMLGSCRISHSVILGPYLRCKGDP